MRAEHRHQPSALPSTACAGHQAQEKTLCLVCPRAAQGWSTDQSQLPEGEGIPRARLLPAGAATEFWIVLVHAGFMGISSPCFQDDNIMRSLQLFENVM